MPEPDICPDCGRDLEKLGVYRDYIHYILGTGTPCLPKGEGVDLEEIENV